MKTFVVIPNWNGKDLLEKCIESLQLQTLRPEIVVVDNGSTDGSVALLKKEFAEVKVVELGSNLGFTGGVNAGIKLAFDEGAEFIALFNNDAVAEKDWLEKLVTTARQNPKAGIVTCKLMRDDKVHLDSTGENYSIWGMPFPRGRNQKDEGQFDSHKKILGATGGATLLRAKMFEEIGLFDEKFFMYMEDVDLSLRAHLGGWGVLYQPSAVAYHQVGATSSKLGNLVRYHFTKNFYLAYLKNMPGWLFWKYLPLVFLQSLRLGAGSLVKGHFLTFVKASLTALWLTPYALLQRSKIQSRRRIPVKEFSAMLYHGRPPKIPTL